MDFGQGMMAFGEFLGDREMKILRGREKGDEYEREQLIQPAAAEERERDSARMRDDIKKSKRSDWENQML